MSSDEKKKRKNHYKNYFREYRNKIKKTQRVKKDNQHSLKFSFGDQILKSENKLKFISSDASK
jgi:hypothetical protein